METTNLSINIVISQYNTKVKQLQEKILSVNTGDSASDFKLLKSDVLEFCRDWQSFANSYKEAEDIDSDRAVKAIEEFNRNVETAINNIALQRKLKDKRVYGTGQDALAYKHVDMSAIVDDYRKGSSITELIDKYNLSRPTLIKRLKELGVFRDGRFK